MKRFRRTTFWSVLFTVLTGVAIFFLIGSGNVLFTVAAGVCIVLASVLRKKESLTSYRDRYEETYGLKDPEDQEDEEES